MDSDGVAVVVAVVLLGLWFLKPYLDWILASARPFEAQVARTSFQCAPGALMPPVWKAPELTLSVVIPAFNEEYRLPPMLDEALTYLESRSAADPSGFSYEVIVVDDGSTDRTYAAAAASGGRRPPRGRGELRVLQLAKNCGKGLAVRVGMLAARGRYLLMADASGSTSIRDLEKLEYVISQPTEEGGAHIAVGSRQYLQAEVTSRRSLPRNTIAAVFQFLLRLAVGGPACSAQCGFQLFRADVGKHVFASLHLQKWAFDLEILVLARVLGVRVAEVPVAWVEMPGSRFDLVKEAPAILRDVVLMQVLYLFGIWHPLMMA